MKPLLLAAILSLCAAPLMAEPRVSNPLLERAIGSYLASGKATEKRRMFAALNDAMYLLPLQEKPEESSLSPISVELPQVGHCMLVFSSNAEVRAAELRDVTLLDMTAEELWDMLDRSPLKCLLLNPGGKPLYLSSEVVEVVRQQ